MVALYLTLNVIADVIALVILTYIISKLAFAKKHIDKSVIARHYEAMKRDRIFRKSLVILALSLLFSLLSAVFAIMSLTRPVINSMQFLSSLFRILFFLYLLNAVRKNM